MAEAFSFLSGSLALENKPFHFRVSDVARKVFSSCHGYIGYKLATLGRASDADVPSFILITKEFGIILLDVIEDKVTDVLESEGAEYWRLDSGEVISSRVFALEIYEDEVASRLKNDPNLYDRKRKCIKVPVSSILVFCSNSDAEISGYVNSDETSVEGITFDSLEQCLNEVEFDYSASDDEMGRVCSLIEGTFIYETKRGIVEEERLETVNDYIQKSLRTTFRQDESQRLAAMQLPPGPQRIRGLAGTGKTIVLCLKAAITHKRFEDYKILYLFNTQSLYQHVQNLITKYYTLEAKRTPDFESKLNVFHAWGGRQKPGLYSTLCQKLGITPLTLADARGRGDSLKFIYKDLLERAGDLLAPEYDLVLIDEAQDFPSEVFEVAYKITKGEGAAKRIIWAYDEFQSLRDTVIKGPSELFGLGVDGQPNLPDSILNGRYEGDIPKDFVLPNCYRTPRPVLMTAHGIAMGLYSSRQSEMFYHSAEWNAIGYGVIEPQGLLINEGVRVEIERPDANSKNLLEGILRDNGKRPLNLVQPSRFSTDQEQMDFLAQKISQLVVADGVAPEEIIVINLSPGNNKNSMLAIQRVLAVAGVRSVIPGYVESADVFKPSGYVTLTTPFRAKGNEANIVFVVNAQRVSDDFTLRMRNAFFVAVTRSRGWCYITGYGQAMQGLIEEIECIKRDFPRFKFVCPSPDRVKNTKSFLDKSDKELDKIQEFMELMRSNPELRELILDQERGNK
ncbi:TPA: DEAD/DEAH box helicase [Pseudomonas aeruginosa]